MDLKHLTGIATHTPLQLKFHEAMRSHGGRLPWELLPPTARAIPAIYELAQALIARAKKVHPCLPGIHFDFINSNAINGVACKSNDEYFIGITGGTVTLLQLMVHRMLADPTLFTSVGNPAKERTDLPHINDFTPNALQLSEAGAKVSIPRDEARWSYSCNLINWAAMFLVGHEIAHISCGHVDYLDSEIGTPYLVELGWSAANAIQPMERQAMEGQADQYSFGGLLGIAFEKSSTEPGASIEAQLADLYRRVFEYSFSANLLFRLLGDERFIGRNLAANPYPPIALRRRFIYGGGCDLASKNLTSDRQDIVQRALKAGMVGVEHAFATVVGEEVSAAGLEDAFTSEGQEHFRLLVELGEKALAPKLKPFSYDYGD
jgi:hypothetical protein